MVPFHPSSTPPHGPLPLQVNRDGSGTGRPTTYQPSHTGPVASRMDGLGNRAHLDSSLSRLCRAGRAVFRLHQLHPVRMGTVRVKTAGQRGGGAVKKQSIYTIAFAAQPPRCPAIVFPFWTSVAAGTPDSSA